MLRTAFAVTLMLPLAAAQASAPDPVRRLQAQSDRAGVPLVVQMNRVRRLRDGALVLDLQLWSSTSDWTMVTLPVPGTQMLRSSGAGLDADWRVGRAGLTQTVPILAHGETSLTLEYAWPRRVTVLVPATAAGTTAGQPLTVDAGFVVCRQECTVYRFTFPNLAVAE